MFKIKQIDENKFICAVSIKELEDMGLAMNDFTDGTDKLDSLMKSIIDVANQNFNFVGDNDAYSFQFNFFPGVVFILVQSISEDYEDEEYDEESEGDILYDDEAEDEQDPGIYTGHSFGSSYIDNNKFLYAAPEELEPNVDDNCKFYKFIEFETLDNVCKFCSVIKNFYIGLSVLYKDNKKDKYLLFLNAPLKYRKQLSKSCNIAIEYGRPCIYTIEYGESLEEKGEILIKKNAVKALGCV